jgi:hypothetical protein
LIVGKGEELEIVWDDEDGGDHSHEEIHLPYISRAK